MAFSGIKAQENETPKVRPIQYYIGIQPSIRSEPYDEFRSTIDINVVPLIIEYAVNRNWSVRINPAVNLQLRPEFPSAISTIGAGITVPYHFSKKNAEEGHRGFYAGPNVAYHIHKVDGFNSAILSGEVGYAFVFNRVFSITVGVQGGSRVVFQPDAGYTRIYGHSAAIFSFGYWF